MTDLSGQKFGMLTVDKLLVERPYSKKKYACTCDCGNKCTRLESTLKNTKHVSNCGCKILKNLKPGNKELCSMAGKHRKDSFVNGSNIQMTFREGTISTNTSGIQGVSYNKHTKKWHVYIGYQSYRANLGYFKNKNEAIIIRHKAEEAIKNNTFEDFFYSIRGYHLGEKNSKMYKTNS